VAFGVSNTRYDDQVFVAVRIWSGATPGACGSVRSTTRPSLSVKLVTVNVPVPDTDDVTVTVQVPSALVVHELAGTAVPAPVHVKAIVASAAGDVDVPSVIVAEIVKSWGTPTGLVADGETVTVYAIHVFDAVAGVDSGMSVNITVLTEVDAIAVTVRSSVPGPVSSTTNWHVPGSRVPVVRHDDEGSRNPNGSGATVKVVPADTGAHWASVGSGTPVT